MINRRFLIAGILFFMALLALPSASAHSALESSNPARDQVLEAFPSELSLTFNEELISIEGESVNTLTLQGTDGANYELLALTVVGAVLSAKAGSAEYPAGNYLLKFRVVSADGHPVTGEISFSTQSATEIGSTPAEPVTTSFIPEPVESSSNTLFFILGGLMLLVGILFGIKRKRGTWRK
jgi:copper resistance protein C